MGLLSRIFKKDICRELNKEEIMEMAVSGKISQRDLINTRDINILGAVLTLKNEGEIKAASTVLGFMIKNRPSILAGNFILNNPDLRVPETSYFKDMVRTPEERAVFYRMYKNNLICGMDDGIERNEVSMGIELAFSEGLKSEENNSGTYMLSKKISAGFGVYE